MQKISEWFTGWNSASTMWIWFIPAAIFTFYMSRQVVKYASGLIEKTKLGALFVGGVIVSIATSLPELVTEVSEGLNLKPAIGLSDDIGANAFSSFIIAVGPLFFIRRRYFSKLDQWTKISIFAAWFMAIGFSIALFFGKDITINLGETKIGLIPIAFFLMYATMTVFYYIYSKRHHESAGVEESEIPSVQAFIEKASKKRIIIGFYIFCILLMFAALLLNISVGGIQDTYNIDEKSAGGIFLSMTTAMPECIAFIYFCREGRGDAAVGAIIGSHIFNLSVILYGDFSYYPGPILEAAGVTEVWKIGLLVILQLGFLCIYLLIHKKIKFKRTIDITLSVAMIASYSIGWLLILLI